MMEVIKWLGENYETVLLGIAGLVAASQVIVRLTPTKVDDGVVTRIGKALDKVMDWLKIPNPKK